PGADESEVSPNGATVAYVNFNNDNLETIPIGGGLPNVVVAGTGQDDQVSWSPDGTKIAVVDTVHCPSNPIGIVSATANNATPAPPTRAATPSPRRPCPVSSWPPARTRRVGRLRPQPTRRGPTR